MFTVGYLLGCGKYLDREAYDTFTELEKPRSSQEIADHKDETTKENERLCEFISESALIAAMDKLYLDAYILPETAAELTEMTEDIIDVYRTEIFPNEEWLSEEGKKTCIEKLDAITLNIIYPDFSSVDYSDLYITPKEEDGTFLDAYLTSCRFLEQTKAKRAARTFDRNEWYPFNAELSTTITNSCYIRTANSINIYAGILEDPAYHLGMSKEELYSGIGAIVGHEISHGFDSGGVQYDKDGKKDQILSDADEQAFNDRADLVAGYYTSIQPYKGSGIYEGSNVKVEATADMGGLKALLTLAKRIDNFDYDLFFRHYALLWSAQNGMEEEQWYFKNDEHPLSFLRINVGVQQFDEFYETYNVAPDDGMYLEKAKRIAVW